MIKMIPEIIEDFDKTFWFLSFWFFVIGFILVSMISYIWLYEAIVWYWIYGMPPAYQEPTQVLGCYDLFVYHFHNPPQYFLDNYLRSTSGEKWAKILLVYPSIVALYTIVYAFIAGTLYVFLWQNFVGPMIGNIISPIVDAAFKNFKH